MCSFSGYVNQYTDGVPPELHSGVDRNLHFFRRRLFEAADPTQTRNGLTGHHLACAVLAHVGALHQGLVRTVANDMLDR